MSLLIVLVITMITLSTAIILEYLSNISDSLHLLFITMGLLVVILINFLKFILWGSLHKRFNLSKTYPMTAIYFPIIYMLSVMKGEIEITMISIISIMLILVGVLMIFTVPDSNQNE